MFFKKKEDKEAVFFDAIMDTVEKMIAESRYELQDIIFAVALAGGIKTKKIAESYSLEKLRKFSEELLTNVGKRTTEEQKKGVDRIQKEVNAIAKKVKK